MDEQQNDMEKDAGYYYTRAVGILDNFLEESRKAEMTLQEPEHWQAAAVFKAFRQANNVLYCLLANTEKSKLLQDTYVVEPVLVGTIGRIIRDLYVLVAYLNTDACAEEDMKCCWDFQVVSRKLVALQYQDTTAHQDEMDRLRRQQADLKAKIERLSFGNKGSVLQGRDEKILSLAELARIKGFDAERFKNEFVFFSQFAHWTAFASHMVKAGGIDKNLFAHMYDLIVAYYVGLVYESLVTLDPTQTVLPDLRPHYEQIISVRWTGQPSNNGNTPPKNSVPSVRTR